MLTLFPGCSCDVCAEEYSTSRPPHSIPCGHVLCAPCITQIHDKTSPNHTPSCPFCRESFTTESMRVVRMDFATSGWSTPRRAPALDTFNSFNSEMLHRKTERLVNGGSGAYGSSYASGGKADVARLEEKVARIAKKKCSVEEVSAVYKELEAFVVGSSSDIPSSLILSAALLHAILTNHNSHAESSRNAKSVEVGLRKQVEELEGEVRRQRTQYNSKASECTHLRQEISQLRALATTLGGQLPETLSPSRSLSPTPTSTPQSTSPTPYSSANSGALSSASAQAAGITPVSRFSSMHSRSLSMSGGRPTTPAAPASPARSHTPAVSSSNSSPRSHTPGPNSANAPRLHTPGINSSSSSSGPRSHTPGPLSSASAQAAHGLRSLSHTPSVRSTTPSLRSTYTSQSSGSMGVPPVPAIPMMGGAGEREREREREAMREKEHLRAGRSTPAHGLSSASAQAAAHAESQAQLAKEQSQSHSQSQSQSHGQSSASSHAQHRRERAPPMMSSASAQAAAYAQAAHTRMQSQTPAPIIPPKPRRLSQPSPPKAGLMMRSSSDEKATAAAGGHVLGSGPNQVWVPPKADRDDDYVLREKEREGHSGYGSGVNVRGVYGMTSASMMSGGGGYGSGYASASASASAQAQAQAQSQSHGSGHGHGHGSGVYGHSSAPTSPNSSTSKTGGFGWFGRSGGVGGGDKDKDERGHQRSASVRPASRMSMGMGRFVS